MSEKLDKSRLIHSLFIAGHVKQTCFNASLKGFGHFGRGYKEAFSQDFRLQLRIAFNGKFEKDRYVLTLQGDCRHDFQFGNWKLGICTE